MRAATRGSLVVAALLGAVAWGCQPPDHPGGDRLRAQAIDPAVEGSLGGAASGAERWSPDAGAVTAGVDDQVGLNQPVRGVGNQEPVVPERPRMDMDATGPMIHPTRGGGDTPPDTLAGHPDSVAERADSAGEQPDARGEGGPRDDFTSARFPRPRHVRGVYVNAWVAGSSRRMPEIIDLARRTEINTVVIDIKDATGYISHATNVPLAREIGATEERRIADLPGLLDRLEAAGIYPIARIVVVKDPILSTYRPELAIQDSAGGVWTDDKDVHWLNLYSHEVWDYDVAIAREVAEMGFPEIQWDYIRFPDAPESYLQRAVYLGQDGRVRADAVRGFLAYAREQLADLEVRSTADVFGVTTSFRQDVGIGQLWETFIDVVDVAMPMVYPSHYWEGSFGYDDPNAHPYEVVHAALRDALRRSATVQGAGHTRPWLQDFSLGAPTYGGAEVRAQIQAAYDVGIDEWILWNPASRYTESALEPVGGFEREPLVRVAGVLAPVSRRYAVMDSVAALPSLPVSSPGSEADGPAALDTITGLAVDTLAAN